MGKVDQPHDPEDQGKSGRKQRVQAAEEDALDDVVYPNHSSHSEVGGKDLLLGEFARAALECATAF